MGYGVDDDNAPAPKNIPDTGTSPMPSTTGCVYKEWNSHNFCMRLYEGHQHEPPKCTYDPDECPKTHLAWFLYMLPLKFIQEAILPATNNAIHRQNTVDADGQHNYKLQQEIVVQKFGTNNMGRGTLSAQSLHDWAQIQ
eukprot:11730931-Ditylum_brightwellii.AAC.1